MVHFTEAGSAPLGYCCRTRYSGWRAIAARFQEEGALAPHLSLGAATDLLASLTSLSLWEELVIGRSWSAERYRSHVTYLAVGALTH